ncbi:MAG: HupE/UreJ family protein [Deltaproteobacteria bacterium]|nr:HupE/UreJ family protein [Deltaproteobacteria bacterium]
MRQVLAALVALVLLLVAAPAFAHKPSDSYLSLEVDGAVVHVRWDIALRDLDYAIGLDKDADGKITWGEVDRARADIGGYATRRLALSSPPKAGATEAPRPCALSSAAPQLAITSHSDGTYAVLRFDATCGGALETLVVDYQLFFDVDPQHRGILRVDAGGATRTHTLSARERSTSFDLLASGRGKQLASIVKEGIVHIWQGYDHILFLLALLLPSVLRREGTGWAPVAALRPALVDVLRIVTAFTVAHSITLSLAALGVVTLPTRLVESAIAASVVLAALNNLRPILRQDRWMAAFLLGLMHGFGFSSTLQDLDLPRSSLVSTLFGFNLGVEIGQVAIVAVFVPLAFAARRAPLYRRWVLVGGSVVILAFATVWLVERAFLVKIIS